MSAQKVEYCTSCGIRLVEKGYVKFPCPQCGAEIGRCASAGSRGMYTPAQSADSRHPDSGKVPNDI